MDGSTQSHQGKTLRLTAETEVVLSLGAINTPKVLMQSGIGDETELRRLGISVVQHLLGVGQNFQDHVAFDCVWEYPERFRSAIQWPRRLSSGRAVPGFQALTSRHAKLKSRRRAAKCCTIWSAGGWLDVVRWACTSKSRGHLRWTGLDPDEPIQIESVFSHIRTISRQRLHV
jgi:choline dehydrogenase